MDTQHPIRVLFADDHLEMHRVVKTLLNESEYVELVGSAANGAEALSLCSRLQPDIVLMDILMPVMNGIEATRAIQDQFPNIKILILSSYHDHENVLALLKQGVAGYITKESLTSDLIQVIQTTMKGKSVLAPHVMETLFSRADPTALKNSFNLTERELTILELASKGLTQQQVAIKLQISVSAVKHHTTNIFRKMNVQNSSEMVGLAIKNKLI